MSTAALSPTLPWWKEPTRAQWATLTAAWLGWVLDAFDFTIFLLVMPAIAKEFGASYTATAGSIALTLLVRLLGGSLSGWVSDRWGRKLPLMLSVVWFALCDGAVAFAPTFTWVLVLRTLFGFGVGAEWTAGSALVMENWPARTRGLASGLLQGSWAIGYLLAGYVAAWVVPEWGWRALFLIAATPALLAFAIRAWVPESPEWERERAKRRQEAMRLAANVDGSVRPEGRNGAAAREARATEAEFTSSAEQASHPGAREQQPNASDSAWSRSTTKSVVWASLYLAASFALYYALSGLYPTMVQVERLWTPKTLAHHLALFNVGMLLGSVALGILAARKGLTLALFLPALALWLIVPVYVGVLWAQGMWLGAFAAGFFGGGMSGTTPLLLTTLFPAAVRARAMGIVYHLGAVGGAFVPMGIATMKERLGWSFARGMATVALTGSVLVLCALILRPKPSESSGL